MGRWDVSGHRRIEVDQEMAGKAAVHRGAGWSRIAPDRPFGTLLRLGSWVRIPSPAPNRLCQSRGKPRLLTSGERSMLAIADRLRSVDHQLVDDLLKEQINGSE